MKKLALILVLVLLAQVAPLGAAEVTGAVRLVVYVQDPCGGCGVDSPGCGDCKWMVKYHGMIKEQLQDRLYDGSIEYRMFNCRILAHDEDAFAIGEQYGAPDSILSIRPITYIGGEDSGIYLPGEALLPYVGEMMDRFMALEDRETIQADIMEIYEESKDDAIE